MANQTENFNDDINMEAVEHNQRMKNENDKQSEYIEMKNLYEEGLFY